MLRQVKNRKEIDKVEDYIKRDIWSLCNVIVEGEKLTGNTLNTLEYSMTEEYLTSNFEFILIENLFKDRRDKDLISYKIEAIIQCKDANYRINDWFTLNTKNDYFGEAEVMADNDYFRDQVAIW